ncbi:hypothetical protein [Aureibacter tunicatorum]|uniref:Uncharacterized protein n=1 Tax=Aureibacter tunicatorum TaxID=866807 RepID=A0AAE4BTI6_9BACT|nr:hypothetical protein [Aureibacter tunicatorum]MDR6239980.1 hypothetical protein [Aureibacter tunicatorum]BDD04452.1 hypothetical protein AUTU_19350 [Aureibacter tunicatorum]
MSSRRRKIKNKTITVTLRTGFSGTTSESFKFDSGYEEVDGMVAFATASVNGIMVQVEDDQSGVLEDKVPVAFWERNLISQTYHDVDFKNDRQEFTLNFSSKKLLTQDVEISFVFRQVDADECERRRNHKGCGCK